MRAFNPLRGYKDVRLQEFYLIERLQAKRNIRIAIIGTLGIFLPICEFFPRISILGVLEEKIFGQREWTLDFIFFLIGLGCFGFIRIIHSSVTSKVFSEIEIDPESKDSKLNLTITSKKENGDIATKDRLTLDNSHYEFYYVGKLIFLECKMDKLPLPKEVIDHYLDLTSKRNEEVLTICFEINSKKQTSLKMFTSLLNKITTSTPF